MISYREKQLLATQKYLLDKNIEMMDIVTKTLSGENVDLSQIESMPKIDSYDDLVEYVETQGYSPNISALDILTPEEIDYIDKHYKEIEYEFKQITKLKKEDIVFLITAIALQVIRQYVLTQFTIPEKRPDHNKTANDTKGDKKETSDRHSRYYNPSLQEIITNPVPFDAIYGSKGIEAPGKGHRAKTLGHNVYFGWIFGTANIATSTITYSNLQSYHVKTGLTKDHKKRDKVSEHAQLQKIFSYTLNKTFNEGTEGKKKIVVSVIKEAIHLKSDIDSKQSMPLPITSMISPELADKLAEYGVDAANLKVLAKQISYSEFINFIIAIIHGLIIGKGKVPSEIDQVRTKKVILYSNIIASSSNAVAVAIGTVIGIVSENPEIVKKSVKALDLGGIIVTICHLFADEKFILKIKKEFIDNIENEQFKKQLQEIEFSLNSND